MIQIINQILAFLTLITQIAVALVLIAGLFRRSVPVFNTVWTTVGAYAVPIITLVSAVAMAGSLFYSEVALYEPCRLCWYQRIAMYPLAVLGIVALFKKFRQEFFTYVLWLSGIGLVIAVFHYYGQVVDAGILPCPAIGYSVSCSQRFVMQFGYITIPLMAATAFALNVVAAIAGKKNN